MKPWLEKILTFRNIEFVKLDRNFNIVEFSDGIQRFSGNLGQVKIGEDSRLHFPELIGIEETLNAVLVGEEEQFHLTAICREIHQEILYFNFYAIATTDEQKSQNDLVILFEDVTQQNVLEQKYVQITNEITLVNQNLSAYKKYLQYIIQYMADALFVTNSTGKIEQSNQAAQNLLEASETELINQPIHQIFQEIKLFPRLINFLDNSPDKKLLFKDLEVNFKRQSGVILTILFNCSVIELDHEQRHFIYIGRDITERKKAEKEMEIALQKERELNELKSNFLSMTSHEFRTPLTVILSAAELLEFHQKKLSDTKGLKYVSQIQKSVENLLELLDNLLLLGQADVQKLILQKKLINLELFCQNLIEELEINSQKSRIVLLSDCPEMTARMDEKLLRHILTNLLSNALKYSPNQTPVYLRLYQESETIVFEVEDQGIGMTPEDKKYLFELFHRGNNVGNIPGTGLGMAIVQKSVEIYGGNLMVSSELEVGTTFKVKLPLN